MIASAERMARFIGRALAVAGLSLLLCFAVATVADGMLRFAFDRPIPAVRDLGGVVAAVAVASCIPLVMVERGNITIRFVSTFLGRRAGRVADFVASVLVEAILIGMAWQFYRFAREATENGNATWMLHIPTAPFWWVAAAMIWIAAAMHVLVVVRNLVGGTPDADGDRATLD